jgi:hypothetical protein
MKEELWQELVKLLEENNLTEAHKELYETVTLIFESIELGKKQNEVQEKLQKLNEPKKK